MVSPKDLFEMEGLTHASLFEGLDFVWQALERIAPYTSQAVALEILEAWFATPWGDKPEDVDCVAQVAEIERKYGKEPCAS